MDILKVDLHLQDGRESLDTFRSRMWAFGGFATVQLLDVVVDMSSPSFSVDNRQVNYLHFTSSACEVVDEFIKAWQLAPTKLKGTD